MGANIFELFLALLAANLLAASIFYSFVVYSRGERRRALSVFLSTAMCIGTGIGFLWLFLVQTSSSGFLILATICAFGVSFAWALSDLTGSRDLEDLERPR